MGLAKPLAAGPPAATYLLWPQLQRALHILGVSMSRVEVELLIKEIDSNGDGEISCNELLQYVLSFDESGEGPHSGDVERGPRR